MMQKLLSLPENLENTFHRITGNSPDEWYVKSDPRERKIGSGGGTSWLIARHGRQKGINSSDKKIIIHAGGQSRRLPAYAPSGKILAPIPVFRWSQGQRIDQSLLDLQLPLLERIMEISGPLQNVLVAAGDVLILSPDMPYDLPEADVVTFGIWAESHLASAHGVFFTSRTDAAKLDFMIQKPASQVIESLSNSHLYLMDTGIWLLSNRAVDMLMKKSGWNGREFEKGLPDYYDLYSTFASSLGEHPQCKDDELNGLSTAVVAMDRAEFYHYGTSFQLITSTEKIQNKVQDQRNIWHNRVKPHTSLFVQNGITDIAWDPSQHHIWIENSHIPSTWKLQFNHIITGIPKNNWNISPAAGICIDMIPVGETSYCLRPYGMDDIFSGKIRDKDTLWMGLPFSEWLSQRGITFDDAGMDDPDIQSAPIFPVVDEIESAQYFLKWMLNGEYPEMKTVWMQCRRLSADQISSEADLQRLFRQREEFRQVNMKMLVKNFHHSVFYQSDLRKAAYTFEKFIPDIPEILNENEPALLRCRNYMLRSEILKRRGQNAIPDEDKAFAVLKESITLTTSRNMIPKLNIYADQIVWGRSPARLDLAGGWSDTPPYCIQNGGSVLNLAVELNGQPPIQVYIRLCQEKRIILRSIDNGDSEVISTFEDIGNCQKIGSAFSIPKAALYLAGFHPDCCGVQYHSLEEQLNEFGGGFEISLLAAIPKGSGLGTSSILAATLLGSLSDFCSLSWDQRIICHKTLIVEQLLTTGGGWQDQYGGILPGIKLLESEPGIQEKINVRWMPDRLFTEPEYKDNWLLYYTGVTRIAKNILADIVRGMFLNDGKMLRIVDEIKQHAGHLANAIQQSDYELTGRMVAHSWKLNNALDSGTNTPEIQFIIDRIRDYANGYKLLGAGGGGYMVIAAKDPEAAGRIQNALIENPPDSKARFVKMQISQYGFQVSRS